MNYNIQPFRVMARSHWRRSRQKVDGDFLSATFCLGA